MTDKLERLFSGEEPPGVYRLTQRMSVASLAGMPRVRLAAVPSGRRAHRFEGRFLGCLRRRDGLSRLLRAQLGRAGGLGGIGLGAGGGVPVLYDHTGDFAEAQPEEFAVAVDILRSVAAYWRETPTPMVVLLRGTGRGAAQVPRL